MATLEYIKHLIQHGHGVKAVGTMEIHQHTIRIRHYISVGQSSYTGCFYVYRDGWVFLCVNDLSLNYLINTLKTFR